VWDIEQGKRIASFEGHVGKHVWRIDIDRKRGYVLDWKEERPIRVYQRRKEEEMEAEEVREG
jgi:hypothetical protein